MLDYLIVLNYLLLHIVCNFTKVKGSSKAKFKVIKVRIGKVIEFMAYRFMQG